MSALGMLPLNHTDQSLQGREVVPSAVQRLRSSEEAAVRLSFKFERLLRWRSVLIWLWIVGIPLKNVYEFRTRSTLKWRSFTIRIAVFRT
jgi:hypothetical protein